MQTLFTLCSLAYLMIYAFEGAIRYGLYNIGANNAILLRDALVVGPLALLLVTQAFRLRVHPAYLIFAIIIGLHGVIATFNLHTPLPAIYGTKLLINVLFGFIAARQLTQPGRAVLGVLALVWLISVVGIALDKFVYTFPWMGLETDIGGIQVDVSRGWDIDGGFEKRAAGFFRSSISAAMLLPILALIIAPRIKSLIVRLLFLLATAAAVTLTTQKGSVIVIVAVTVILCAPAWSRYSLLCLACMGFAAIDVALPLFTTGLLTTNDGGVFSFASFAMRISLTWPDAWQWIKDHDVFPLGVGLGGIGGAQRFYAPNSFNPSDNFFIFLYANFGVLSLYYLGWTANVGRRLAEQLHPAAIAPLAILAFNLGYGAALSMLEDQASALFIGAAVGMLWQLHQTASGGIWSDPYAGARMRLRESFTPAYAMSGSRAVRAR